MDPAAAKAVVLAHRPPISIPRTTVAPALLEELLGEVGSLASVYHKPSETFIGKGRIGADAVRKAGDLSEDQFSTQKALQTVVAGQQAENLLDFDDSTNLEGQPSGLAATQVLSQTPAAANLLAGTSSNPLDDLVSIFGGGGTPMPPATPMTAFGGGAFMTAGPFGGISSAPPTPVPGYAPPNPNPQPQKRQQEDLLGLF